MVVDRWKGFPDPDNPGSELSDHTFAVMADHLGWSGTEDELMEWLRRLQDENQGTDTQTEYKEDPPGE